MQGAWGSIPALRSRSHMPQESWKIWMCYNYTVALPVWVAGGNVDVQFKGDFIVSSVGAVYMMSQGVQISGMPDKKTI